MIEMNSYLLSNFHSICEKNNSLNSVYNRFAFTSLPDYNGSGLISADICAKNNIIANFYAQSPTLPFFINRSRIKNNYFSKNGLIVCKNEDNSLFITTDEKNKIFGLLLEENKVTESEGSPQIQSKPHIYSANQSVSNGPFRYCTQKLCHLYAQQEVEEDFWPIIELKVHKSDENRPQIQSNSRNKICFFRFKCDEDSDLSLDLFSELNVETLRRSDDSLFENCDRNQLIDNQLLVSFTTDEIHLYDFETNQTIHSFDTKNLEHNIGVEWGRTHPMMFFTGNHKRLQYRDSRCHKTDVEFFTKRSDNLFNWEMFYEFLPSKLNPNQVFVATDLHIVIADWRYPKKNLIQLNHMIPQNIIRSLKSLEVFVDNKSTELLIASDFDRNCLMSFTSSPPVVQLSSTHLPLHLSNPKDVNKKFEEYFYRGIELMDSADNSGFSLALLTNSGDIFVQDLFWCTSSEEMTAREGEPNYTDRTFCSGVGSSHLKTNPKTDRYIDEINNFLHRLKTEIKVETNFMKECLTCTLHRVCRLEDDECLCRNVFDYNICHKEGDTPQKPPADRKALISELYQKHFGPEILKIKERLENKELLIRTSDKYTKSIFKPWNLFEESND